MIVLKIVMVNGEAMLNLISVVSVREIIPLARIA
jgi:hypothetical protein